MPKVKKTAEQEASLRIRAIIERQKIMVGKNNDEIADQLGLCKATFYRRLRQPLDFTVREYLRLSNILEIDESEVKL